MSASSRIGEARFFNHEADLAPGDQASRRFDWTEFEITKIDSPTHPLFQSAYQKLWDEFGTKGELETVDVLARRMKWNPRQKIDGSSLLYELVLVTRAGKFAAVRDHTAIVRDGAAVVHLSHVLIDGVHRGSGMIGWLRAWPIEMARECLAAIGLPGGAITLVAEMEPPQEGAPDRAVRLKSYGRAGFLKVDPLRVDYWQPDFRSPEQIDEDGGAKPLPLQLIIRRVGHELEKAVSGAEVKGLVDALYRMYGVEFRAGDMKVVWDHLRRHFPSDSESVSLVDPLGGSH